VSNEKAETIVTGLGWQKEVVPAPAVVPVVEDAPAPAGEASGEVGTEATEAPAAEGLAEEPSQTGPSSQEEAAPDTSEPAEPAMITVWRLVRTQRRDGQQNRPPRRDGQGPRSNEAGKRPARAARPAGTGRHPGADPGRDGGNRPPFDRGNRKPGGRSRQDGRQGNDRGRDDRPRVISAGPEDNSNRKGIDPSNPFAALAALKTGRPSETGGGKGKG
jgi:ATP-dependent RNA helicase SUPV3L1/SUV3